MSRTATVASLVLWVSLDVAWVLRWLGEMDPGGSRWDEVLVDEVEHVPAGRRVAVRGDDPAVGHEQGNGVVHADGAGHGAGPPGVCRGVVDLGLEPGDGRHAFLLVDDCPAAYEHAAVGEQDGVEMNARQAQ